MIFEQITFKLSCHFVLCTKNFAFPCSYCSVQNFVLGSKCRKCSVHNFVPGSRYRKCFCTLHFTTYPDVVYKVATAAILIQTSVVQSVFSLENFKTGLFSELRTIIKASSKKHFFSVSLLSKYPLAFYESGRNSNVCKGMTIFCFIQI